MADMNEHVAYLAQEIGPRPAGTEEEQRAALYISERLAAEPGLSCTMEDFQCNPDSTLPRALCSGVAVIVILLATILSVLAIPAIVIALVCAALVAAEVFDKPVLSRMLNRGVSQNVVAKYLPIAAPNRATRRRKVIVIANYDTGKVRRDLSDPVIAVLPYLYWAELGALVLMPLVMIVRTVLAAEGTTLLAFNIVLAVLMVIAVLPLVSFLFEKMSSYNEGANCNAAGVAVLMDVAARVAAARNLPDEENPTIHGEAAAASAGLIPEGAEISYQMGNTSDELGGSMESAAARLAAAKAAVAALTGKPVSETVSALASPAAPAEDSAAERAAESGIEDAASASPSAAVAVEVPQPSPEVAAALAAAAAPKEPEVPEWFKQGQAQAKKPKKEKPAQRSRYAMALERAQEEINAREESERNAAEELADRMRGMRESVQAASEAAGATPTGVIADLEAVVSAEVPAAPRPEVSVMADGVLDEAAAQAADAAAADAAMAALMGDEPVAPAAAVPAADAAAAPAAEVPLTVPAVAPTAEPAPAAAPADAASVHPNLAGLPSIIPTDDPDVVLREGQRPLTGSMAPVGSVDSPTVAAAPVAAEPQAPQRLVIPSVGEVAVGEAPAAAPTPAVTGAQPAQPVRRRRAISLPDIGISQELPRISMDDRQQAAPLAEERPAYDGRVRDLSALIPSVGGNEPAPQPAAQPAAESALMSALPSLSQAAAAPGLSGSINMAGSFSSMGATGAAAPIGDELIAAASEEDLYIDDADDSAYVAQTTETGAMAGPGYVEMPRGRFGRLFNRRRKKRDQESTPQEWLDVEENFDAREVGAARGGWESFRQEDEAAYDYNDGAYEGSYEENYSSPSSTSAFDISFDSDEVDEFPAPRSARPARRGRHFEGGAFSRNLFEGTFRGKEKEEEPVEEEAVETEAPRDHGSVFGEGLPSGFVFDNTSGIEQIQQFRSERIDMEVWFVALGSELAGNGGIRAFMETHEAELKGSIFIELEGLGAGELTLIEREGTFLSKKASSRMKRLSRKAGQAVGLKVPETTMEWRDSASAYILKHGQQAMHMAGMSGRKPAFFAEADDVAENIDSEQIQLNGDFVMELLKSI